MPATKVQNFILYSLGRWFEEANKKIVDKSLQVSISKVLFIDLVKKAQLAEKQGRALYKNLEALEKKKIISYQNKEMQLTAKGEKMYQKIKEGIEPYLNVYTRLKEKDPTSYTKKVQTIFR